MRSESQRDPAWKDWHTILYGKEACRQTEKWSFTVRPTKEQALEAAGAYLRRGYIVHAIQFGGGTVMDEAALLKYCS
jgi:hypothetical protein